jgi:hypothetical protein
MNKNAFRLIKTTLRLAVACCFLAGSLTTGQKVQRSSRILDIDGNGRDDIINVFEKEGKIAVDLFSLKTKSFVITTMSNSFGKASPSMKIFHGDFNGDGQSDLASLWEADGKTFCEVALTEGTKSLTGLWINNGEAFDYSDRWLKGDFNADGKTDIAKIRIISGKISVDVYTSTGNGFIQKSWITDAGSWNNNNTFLPGDFNGDGATDIGVFRTNAIDLFLANPASGTFRFQERPLSDIKYESSYRLFCGDFNGDKKLDVAKIWSELGQANIDLLLSGDNGFIGSRAATHLGENEYGMRWFPGDFNGDGRSDLVKIYNKAGKLNIDVYESDGRTFGNHQWYSSDDPVRDTQRWFSGDYNGDGKADLAVLSIEKGSVHLHWYEAGNHEFISHKDVLNYSGNVDRIQGNMIYVHKYIDPAWIQGPVPPGIENVRKAMASGQDVWLVRGETYNRYTLEDNLTMSANQQILSTFDAVYFKDFATIRMAGKLANNMVSTQRVDETLIQNLIGDGNAYGFDAAVDGADRFTVGGTFISAGTMSGHRIKRVIAYNSRTQSLFKLMENPRDPYSSVDNRIENCIAFGNGVDARGAGCNLTYKNGWADAVGMSSVNSRIVNNLVIDGTDVGIVCFTTPGGLVEDNVVVSLSRETLGAINLVDFLKIYTMKTPPDSLTYFDYSLTIRNNYMDALGSRFHNGIAVGDGVWSPKARPLNYGVGQVITGNIMDGDCFGYGISVRTGKNMKITDNISYAKHSGTADGFRNGPLPDPAAAFLMESPRLINCNLQPEFKEAKKHLSHLLYMNYKPKRTDSPYKIWDYTPEEADGIVRTAFIEMLRRMPKQDELESYTKDLMAKRYSADSVRFRLLSTPEFTNKNGVIPQTQLHVYRTNLWMTNLKSIDAEYINEHGDYPSALHLYNGVLKNLSGIDMKRFSDRKSR